MQYFQTRISIITPCFNAAKHIEQTIISIVNQGYENLEYIIIDGGSTDGTVDIIKKYQDKITYWVSEPDNGQSDAINKGISKATGDIFNWINADDYLEEGALALVASEFQKGDIDILCTNTILFNEKGNIRINGGDDMNLDWLYLLKSSGLNQMGMYWRTARVKELKGVNTAFHYSMDLDLFKRYLLCYGSEKIRFKNTITGYFRLSDSSKTGADFSENFHLFERENHAAMVQYAKAAGTEYEEAIKHLYPKYKENLASCEVYSPVPQKNAEFLVQSILYEKMKRFFYAEDYKQVARLAKKTPVNCFDDARRKDLKSFTRWSRLKKWIK